MYRSIYGTGTGTGTGTGGRYDRYGMAYNPGSDTQTRAADS